MIQEDEMRPLGEGESYDHLGTLTGFNNNQTPYETISGLINDVRAVDASLLAPWQKLDAVASFLLPRLDFCLGTARVEKSPLKLADKIIKKAAKGWLNLPQRASAEHGERMQLTTGLMAKPCLCFFLSPYNFGATSL
ncbi:hypothetical protein M0804_015120 [Polistes exclamans]|nr:hypothetical protein M0804_015120 [Polistes exclamans]